MISRAQRLGAEPLRGLERGRAARSPRAPDRRARRGAPRPHASARRRPGTAVRAPPTRRPQATHASGSAWRWSRVASASHSRSQAADSDANTGRVATTSAWRWRIASSSASPASTAARFAVGAAPRPGELGGVGVRPQAERVELADPDLGREVDQADRRGHDRRPRRPGGPRHRASSARLDLTGSMNWMSSARSASGASGRRRSAASSNAAPGERQPPEQLLGRGSR